MYRKLHVLDVAQARTYNPAFTHNSHALALANPKHFVFKRPKEFFFIFFSFVSFFKQFEKHRVRRSTKLFNEKEPDQQNICFKIHFNVGSCYMRLQLLPREHLLHKLRVLEAI